MKWFFSLYLSFLFLNAHAQSDSTYQMLVAKANLFHLQKDYKSAISIYERAFQRQKPDALTAYKAAGMYSLSNNSPKAFQYLQLAISSGWTEAEWLISDPYFDHLKKTNQKEWKKIKERAYNKEQLLEKSIVFPALRKEINLITLNDQRLRYTRVQSTNDSIIQIIDQQINQSDLKNLNRANDIIRQYGWLKKSEIGKDGQNNLWLIVQHADQDVLFQQKALFAMEKLLGTKEINMENYAFLYDRVQCNLNYKQLYGTQVVWKQNGEASGFRPIIEEHKVNKRREKLGLQSLQVYAQSYGFNYQEFSLKQSSYRDSVYRTHVQLLLDSARECYENKAFQKTYNYYNNASTFLGGMNDMDNFKAAVVLSKIASEDKDDRYKNIALDFLDLLSLRKSLTKIQLLQETSFKILYNEQRWIDLNKALH
jgi:hypothetical protein